MILWIKTLFYFNKLKDLLNRLEEAVELGQDGARKVLLTSRPGSESLLG